MMMDQLEMMLKTQVGNNDCQAVAGVYCSAVKEDFQEVPENIYVRY